MNSFAQWLFLAEADNRRQQNRFQDFSQRVQYGKMIEARIIRVLENEYGWKVDPVSTREDKYDKADGLVRFADPQVSINLPAYMQVKYRDTGDDLLMEVVWELPPDAGRLDIDQLLTGRDMKGKAQIYVNLNQAGNLIRVRSADEAKEIARTMLEQLLTSGRRSLRIGANEIRVVQDPRDNRTKINAFLSPEAFSWKADYPVSEAMWAEPEPMAELKPFPDAPKDISPQMLAQLDIAMTKGSAAMPVPNNMKKVKSLQRYASRRGVSVGVEGDRLVLQKAV